MGELVELQVDDQIATQEAVVEDEIEKVVVAIEGESLLPRLEEEALAEFEEEVLQVRDEGGLEIRLGVGGLLGEAEEFKDERFFEEVFGSGDDLAFLRQLADGFFVTAEGEAFVKAGGFLASEFR